jgi:redox-sensing transcriptional repressor
MTQPHARQQGRTVVTSSSRRGISEKAVARLALYRRLLIRAGQQGKTTIYSHEIASISGASPAQVRRDLMGVGYLGHRVHGYEISGLRLKIEQLLGNSTAARIALVGIGNLGRALLTYFAGSSGQARVVAAFDVDPEKVDRTISGCHCYPAGRIQSIVRRERIDVAIIAVPATEAQSVAEQLIASGVRSLINLAPVPLQVPPHVFVEELDISILVERAAFFARSGVKKV